MTKLFLIILSICSFAQSTKDAVPDPADELWLRFYADSRGVYFYNIAEMSEENGTFINLKIKTNFRKPELMPGINKEIFCEITSNL
ncbi:MAG: hypothetical protein IAE91_00240, partial [Ignavibacteriaceae bacterium]|nr:hypothetical protein [Ignavibacteriaceae bacterium]